MLDLNPKFSNHQPNYRPRFNGGPTGVQFKLETMDEDSGVCLPPLWRSTSPPDSPVRFPNRSLSPSSRAQAIARGQREMMEMVENMPETSYELSLKDIVDPRLEFTDASVDETQSMEDGEQRLINGGGQGSQRRRVRRHGKTGRVIVKNGSMNNNNNNNNINNNNKGLLINMFLPFSIGSKKKHINNKKKKKKENITRTNSHLNSFNQSGWTKVTDSGYSESLGVTSSSSGGESTGRSGSSGSGSSTDSSLRNNSDRREDGCTFGCWSLFPYRKKKSLVFEM